MIVNNFCRLDEETKNAIRDKFDATLTVQRDTTILREWIKQQQHLPQNQDDDFLEICLARNKFRIEPTKTKLEKYYTLKGRHLEIFRNVKTPPPCKTNEILVPLSQLTNNYERIIIVKINNMAAATNENDDNDDVMEFLKYVMCLSEYSLRCDYTAGHRIIQDFEGFTLNHIAKYSTKLTAYAAAYQDAYFHRIAGIEYINVPSYFHLFMQTTKILLNSKIFKKITIHKNLESLHQNVDKKFLPKDYGGDQKSLNELLAEWNGEFIKNVKCLENIIVDDIADESKRIGDIKSNGGVEEKIFGLNGTFKSLNVD